MPGPGFNSGGSLVERIDKNIEIIVDSVECSCCGEELSFTLSLDSHGDLEIKVDPCSHGGQS
jgi:hypothetical protein